MIEKPTCSRCPIIWFLPLVFFATCKHEPIVPEGFDPDNPPDTTTPPPVDTSGTPCETGVIYFANDVQPILSSSCAVPGCHDAAAAESDVILVSYTSTMQTGEVRPGQPGESKIYKKITEAKPEDKMPPPDSGITLTAEQINIIRDWIAQGAQNLTCDPYAGGCDSINVTFNATVQPIINNSCRGCHSGAAPQGNVNLENYSSIQAVVNDGRLLKAITHAPGVAPMPRNQPKLSNCKIAQIRKWINDGAPHN